MMAAINLSTFYGIYSTEWPYMTPFGMDQLTASLYPATLWLPVTHHPYRGACGIGYT